MILVDLPNINAIISPLDQNDYEESYIIAGWVLIYILIFVLLLLSIIYCIKTINEKSWTILKGKFKIFTFFFIICSFVALSTVYLFMRNLFEAFIYNQQLLFIDALLRWSVITLLMVLILFLSVGSGILLIKLFNQEDSGMGSKCIGVIIIIINAFFIILL